MSCIYMLSTCHNNNNTPNLWLDFDLQLEYKKKLYKNITYMHQIYNNTFLNLKNMNWFFLYAFLYMHLGVWFLFGISYKDSMYDILKQ
jgi:hypothetical protein